MTAPTDLENHASETDTPTADATAPYGYTLSGRPRRGPGGRPAGRRNTADTTLGDDVPPTLDELKASAGSGGPADTPPSGRRGRRGSRRTLSGATPAPQEPRDPPPPFRAGPIATGVNKLYRRAGKIIRTVDPMLGAAVISTTIKDADDDTTVGEAWEEIARTNVRVRVILLKLITGGAWGQLLVCHLPIAMAILMKESVRSHIPFGNLLFSVLEDDGMESQDPTGFTGAFPPDGAGIDMAALMNLAAQMTGQQYTRMNGNLPRRTPGEEFPGQTTLDDFVTPEGTDWVVLDQK